MTETTLELLCLLLSKRSGSVQDVKELTLFFGFRLIHLVLFFFSQLRKNKLSDLLTHIISLMLVSVYVMFIFLMFERNMLMWYIMNDLQTIFYFFFFSLVIFVCIS